MLIFEEDVGSVLEQATEMVEQTIWQPLPQPTTVAVSNGFLNTLQHLCFVSSWISKKRVKLGVDCRAISKSFVSCFTFPKCFVDISQHGHREAVGLHDTKPRQNNNNSLYNIQTWLTNIPTQTAGFSTIFGGEPVDPRAVFVLEEAVELQEL